MIDPFKLDRECTKKKLDEMSTIIKNSKIFNMFGLTTNSIERGFFKGTLLWLPLRTKANHLSSTVWNSSKMKAIIDLYTKEASMVIMFLKSISRIEIFHLDGNNVVELEMDENDREANKKLFQNEPDMQDNYVYSKTEIRNGRYRMKLAMVNFYAGKETISTNLASLVDDKEIGCLPYVSLALQYGTTRTPGRIFNCLPLPSTNISNLPIHVNGQFALSQNRRTLKLSGYGESSDKFVRWNELLVIEVVTRAYIKLLEHLVKDSKSNSNSGDSVKMVYDCLPREQKRLYIWSRLVDSLYSKIAVLPLFFTPKAGGQWVNKNEAMLVRLTNLKVDYPKRLDIQKTIKKVLLILGKPVIEDKENMQTLINKSIIEEVKGRNFTCFLMESPCVLNDLTWKEKIGILWYIIEDDSTNLKGLPLIPLANGEFQTFGSIKTTVPIYMASTAYIKLFPGKEDRFISPEIPVDLTEELRVMINKNQFQLTYLQDKDIPRLLEDVFKLHLTTEEPFQKYVPKCSTTPLTIEWLKSLWNLIKKMNANGEYKLFEHLPLLPQYDQRNTGIDFLYVLKGEYVLSSCEKFHFQKLPENVLHILLNHGATVVDCNEIILSSNIIGKYVKLPSFECIMELCKSNPEMRNKIQRCVGLGRNLRLTEGTSATSFGQREELVTRLKGILASYPQDDSVLKEMIQNADDAGATEIHFLLDMRTHKTKRTFDERWNQLHGPALCVYNDGIFTDSDLDGLKHLGTGSKIDDRSKTGQFGIGFNSVYHLTDAPCILALGPHAARGGVFCVFDPHCRYAPLSHYGDPGMVMESNELHANYPDVFEIFLSTGELKQRHGTWFRIPLRRLQHETSQISNKTYEAEDVLEILNTLKENVQENLIFLLTLKKITVSYVDIYNNHKIICETKAVCDQKNKKIQNDLKTHLRDLNEKMKGIPISILEKNISEYMYSFSITVNGGLNSKWLVIQNIGMYEPTKIDDNIRNAYESQEIKFLPKGGVAFPMDSNLESAKAFCLLPLPVVTGLACHTDGQFAVDVSRNTLWGSDQGHASYDVRRQWNIELLKRNIAPAYASGIFELRNKNNYDKQFPLFQQAKGSFWEILSFHVYFQIKIKGLPVYRLSSRGEQGQISWVSAHNNHLLVDDLSEQKHTKELVDDLSEQEYTKDLVANDLHRVFSKLGMNLIGLPSDIQESIYKACEMINDTHGAKLQNCLCLKSISPSSVIEYLSSKDISWVERMFDNTIKDIKLCLKYCLKEEDVNAIIGLPLLLKNDDHLSRFQKENTLILTQFLDLLPISADRFVHSDLIELSSFKRLSFQKLTGSEFEKMLKNFISESEYKKQQPIQMREEGTPLSLDWLHRFWKFIDERCNAHEQLGDWNLLPITFIETNYLLPINLASRCIDYDSFSKGVHQGVIGIMKKIGLPSPAVKSVKLSELLVKYEKVIDVVDAIHFWKEQLFENILSLTEVELVQFCEYLITEKSFRDEVITKLKDIPLFVTVNGNFISLSHSQYFAVRDVKTSLTNSLQRLFDRLNLKVLKYFPCIDYMYQIISCKIISMVNLYARYVLPYFKYVEKGYHFEHMDYIRETGMICRYYDICIAMQEVSFLPLRGILRKANEFYSPDHDLFSEFSNDIDFPPAPYVGKEWKGFLIRAGLKNDVTERIILDLATIIAKRYVGGETSRKCEVLLKHLEKFIRSKDDICCQFKTKLSSIRFIPVDQLDRYLTDICASTMENVGMSSLDESYCYDKRHLVWTVATVLPQYIPVSIIKTLEIKIPHFNTVKAHIRNVCSAMQGSCNANDKSIQKIMEDIYSYLQGHKIQMNELIGIPIIHIPLHAIFVYPHQIVRNLIDKDEIIPYMMKAPDVYGTFFEIFGLMGMQNNPTTSTYCKVLDQLHKDCSCSPLSPPELKLTQKALYGFMKTLKGAEQSIQDLDVKKLYLLSETGQLMPSDTLYFHCLSITRDRLLDDRHINFLVDLECIGINVSQLPDLFASLPERYRPKSIQSEVKETIDHLTVTESETVARLRELLTSYKFTDVLLRICKYDQNNLKREFTVKDMRRIAAKLRRLRVCGVSDLKTVLQRNGQTIKSTRSNKTCFFSEDDEVLYVNNHNVDIDRWLQDFSVDLERCLQTIAFRKYKLFTLLGILQTFNAHYDHIEAKLTEIGIPSLEKGFANEIWYPSAGSLVPISKKSSLQKPYHPISVGQYAVFLVNHLEETDINLDVILTQDVILVYVIITELIQDINGELISYKVNIGKDEDIQVQKCLLLVIKPRPVEVCDSDEEDTPVEFKPFEKNTTSDVNDICFSRDPNPQPKHGRVLLKQAKFDLQSGHILMEALRINPTKCYNWVCLQCQQAAEKAIKGALCAVDEYSVRREHNLLANVPDKDDTLRSLASELQGVVGHINSLRYPVVYSEELPADKYSRKDAEQSIVWADEIVRHVAETYFGHDTK